jgi:hypothetical protein
MNRYLILILALFPIHVFSQEIISPAAQKGFSGPSSYQDLSEFLTRLDQSSDILVVDTIGKTVQNRNIYAMKFSSSGFGKDASKIKVLILTQQHGNEPSGKEGALLLAAELLKPENSYLFKRIDLLVVPQMNPDGSELNQRRNGNGMDLNRNHLILSEPETRALHKVFDEYLFEVTMDVHEYYPFGEKWREFGYRNNSAELMGITTNCNISEKIRNLSKNGYLPFIKQYFDERGISNFIYSPGGPPETEYIRHSTFDINDGRQSFGIQNTFSFIQEGMNGTDAFVENLTKRAEAQKIGMRGLLEYSWKNKKQIKKLVSAERARIIHFSPGENISVQSEHAKNGEKLHLPVYSYYSNTDSVIIVNNYRPVVRSIGDVTKPSGYLIPKSITKLTDWTTNQSLTVCPYVVNPGEKIEQYNVISIDSIDFEGDTVVNPNLLSEEMKSGIIADDYLYIPVSQLKGNLICIALEPKSMLGLVTYKGFADLLVAGEKFPVLRVIRK